MDAVYCVICTGNPFYLRFSLAQLKKIVGSDRVLLVGDSSTVDLCWEIGVSHFHIEQAEKEASAMISTLAENFINDGPNPDEFELFCFKRFFYLSAVATRLKLARVIHVDADILFLREPNISRSSSVDAIPNPFGTYLSSWSAANLKQFTDYVLNTYFNNEPIYRYCDMDALALFYKSGNSDFCIVEENGYKSNVRLDLGFRYFIIRDWYNSILERGIGFNSMEAEVIERLTDEQLNTFVKISSTDLTVNSESLDFVHLQGNTKQYFEFFAQKLGLIK